MTAQTPERDTRAETDEAERRNAEYEQYAYGNPGIVL